MCEPRPRDIPPRTLAAPRNSAPETPKAPQPQGRGAFGAFSGSGGFRQRTRTTFRVHDCPDVSRVKK